MQKWQIDQKVADQIRALCFDPEAKPIRGILPISGIYWPDEFPNGCPTIEGSPESQKFIFRIYLIRAEYWKSKRIKADDLPTWKQAQEMFPNWPLLIRMEISATEYKAYQESVGEGFELINSLFDDSDTFDAEVDEHGIGSITATYYLKKDKDAHRGKTDPAEE